MKIPRAVILGGGVTGLTTGIVLQMHGYRTSIFTHRVMHKIHPTDYSRRPSEIASIHAAASVLPHSAKDDRIPELTRLSQNVFHRLAFSCHFGVRQQRHYELYEVPKEPPVYAREVEDFLLLSKEGDSWTRERCLPMRKGARGVWGWHFNAFFAEVPTYLQSLTDAYLASGGELIVCENPYRLDEFIEKAKRNKADVAVVCAGYASPSLLGTGTPTEIPVTRGHMVKVHLYDVPRDDRGKYFSYNYTPEPITDQYTDVSARSDGNGLDERTPTDVYFYPRSDGWLLGGSRQPGFFNSVTGEWRPKIVGMSRDEFESKRDYFRRSREWLEKIPRRIWDLNRELILDITEVDIARFPSSSYIGYRFLTEPIEIGKDDTLTDQHGMLLLKNFGHGGSGYTLSWGAAWKLLSDLERSGFSSAIRPYRDVTTSGSDSAAMAVLTILEDLARTEFQRRSMPDFSRTGSAL